MLAFISIPMDENKRILLQHERIGFSSMDEQDQADLLIWHNVETINKLTPGFQADLIPIEVGKRYITLSKNRFREYFIKSGYIEKLNDIHRQSPKLDSQWVEQTSDSRYQLKVQERGGLVHIEFFDSYDEVIDYFVDWKFRTFDR